MSFRRLKPFQLQSLAPLPCSALRQSSLDRGEQISSAVLRGYLAVSVPGDSRELWIHLVCASCCEAQSFPYWSHHPHTSDTPTGWCSSDRGSTGPKDSASPGVSRGYGAVCRQAQPRGRGGVGDTVPAATGAARAVCDPGYHDNGGRADPDNPRVKVQDCCTWT